LTGNAWRMLCIIKVIADEADAMKLIELPDTLAERIGCLIQPVLRPDQTRRESADMDLQGKWQTVNSQLAGWKCDPDQLEDEGVRALSYELVEAAEEVAEALRGHGVDPPDTLVTNGDGGIVMRWRLSGRTWSIELDSDGSIESSLMVGSRLLWRHSIHQDAARAS
jgi:hypothetical protein